jgi:hypothetical protein
MILKQRGRKDLKRGSSCAQSRFLQKTRPFDPLLGQVLPSLRLLYYTRYYPGHEDQIVEQEIRSAEKPQPRRSLGKYYLTRDRF